MTPLWVIFPDYDNDANIIYSSLSSFTENARKKFKGTDPYITTIQIFCMDRKESLFNSRNHSMILPGSAFPIKNKYNICVYDPKMSKQNMSLYEEKKVFLDKTKATH